MSTLSLIAFGLGTLVMVAAGAAVAFPLYFQRLEAYALPANPAAAFNERSALLEGLAELEREFHAGKLSEADYRQESERLQRAYLLAVEAEERRNAAAEGV
ncbi:MAG: hypothetical protein HY423_14025 [Candidatus Lambdaproteobacteria bacterium]|nr:hypothetical protein [Candidatus Lambdaproteobacteria bacterium]